MFCFEKVREIPESVLPMEGLGFFIGFLVSAAGAGGAAASSGASA